MNDENIQKFLDGAGAKIKHAVDNISITPSQARHASVMGQVGGGAGAITGAVIGTGIGVAAHHPAQGAGIGAAIGGALGGSGGSALGVYSARAKNPPRVPASQKPKKAKKIAMGPQPIGKSFMHPTDSGQRKVAQAGLVGAQIADIAAVKSAWKETTEAKKVGTGLKSTLKYAGQRAALPLVVGGVGATVLAEHVMHQQEKKKQQQQATPKQPSMHALGVKQSDYALAKSATKENTMDVNEVFAKARTYDESKHKRGDGGKFARGVAVASGVTAGGAGAASGAGHLSSMGYRHALAMDRGAGVGLGEHLLTSGMLAHGEGMTRQFGNRAGKVALGATALTAGAAALAHHQKQKAKIKDLEDRTSALDGGVKKNADIDAVNAIFAKARSTEIEKGALGLAEAGEKIGQVANEAKGFVTNPINHATVRSVAHFHAGNLAGQAQRLGTHVAALPTAAKVGGASGASFLAGAAAMHHHLGSSDVEKRFSDARAANISKLEPETRKGLKVGAAIGAGIGAARGAVSGAVLGGGKGAAFGALGGAASHGLVGGGLGAGVGAIKASARQSAEQALKNQKPRKPKLAR